MPFEVGFRPKDYHDGLLRPLGQSSVMTIKHLTEPDPSASLLTPPSSDPASLRTEKDFEFVIGGNSSSLFEDADHISGPNLSEPGNARTSVRTSSKVVFNTTPPPRREIPQSAFYLNRHEQAFLYRYSISRNGIELRDFWTLAQSLEGLVNKDILDFAYSCVYFDGRNQRLFSATGHQLQERVRKFLEFEQPEYQGWATGQQVLRPYRDFIEVSDDWLNKFENCFLGLDIDDPPPPSVLSGANRHQYKAFQRAALDERDGFVVSHEGLQARRWMENLKRESRAQLYVGQLLAAADSLSKAGVPISPKHEQTIRDENEIDDEAAPTESTSSKRKWTDREEYRVANENALIESTGLTGPTKSAVFSPRRPPLKKLKTTLRKSLNPSGTREGGKAKCGNTILMAHIKQFLNDMSSEKNGHKGGHNWEDYEAAIVPSKGDKIVDAVRLTPADLTVALASDVAKKEEPEMGHGRYGSPTLETGEIDLCHFLKMEYGKYQCQKRRFFLGQAVIIGANQQNADWQTTIGKSQAQQIACIDVRFVSVLWAEWKKWGWVGEGNQNPGGVEQVFWSHFDQEYVDRCLQMMRIWERRSINRPKIISERLGPQDDDVEGAYATKESQPKAVGG